MGRTLNDDMALEEEDAQKDRFLIFSLYEADYGIEIEYVTEIIGIQVITEIPQVPEYVKGIINLRGEIIPVIDMRLRFKKPPLEYNDRTCIVIVNIKEVVIGLIVDRVLEVSTIKEEDIVEPPRKSKEFNRRFIKKIGKVSGEVKLLIDCENLLSQDELEELNETV